jgi:peptidoglycan biosynthesis protein MviN/MurJ (putative lipid II flippase)
MAGWHRQVGLGLMRANDDGRRPASIRALRVRLSSSYEIRALAGTLLGNAPGLLLPFVMTSILGIGRDTDAYFYAFSLTLLAATLSTSVLENNLLPAIQQQRAGGATHLRRWLKQVAAQSVIVVSCGYLIVATAGSVLVLSRSTWTTEEQQACLVVLAILAIFMATVAVNSVLAATHYSTGDFLTPTITLALRSVVPGIALIFVNPGYLAIEILAGGVVVGEALRGVTMSISLRSRLKELSQAGAAPVVDSHVWRTAAPQALSQLMTAVAPVIDRSFAAPLGAGSVTLIDLSEKVFYAPMVAINSSLVLVAGARWARIGTEDVDRLSTDYHRTVRRALSVSCVIMLLVIVATIVVTNLSPKLVAGADSLTLRDLIIYLMLGLPAGVIITLGGRFLVITRQVYLLPYLAAINFIANTLGDLVGVHYLGLSGIVLASTVQRWLLAGIILWLCRRLLTTKFERLRYNPRFWTKSR